MGIISNCLKYRKMKKIVINIINIVAAIFFAVACIDDKVLVEPTPGKDVVFSAGVNHVDTKTLYGADNGKSVMVKWVDGDKVKVYGASCAQKQAEYEISVSGTNTPNVNDGKSDADGMTKTGAAGVQWGNSETSDFYAVYPSSAAADFAPLSKGEGVKVKTTIASSQYSSFSKSGQIWTGVPFDFSNKTMRMNNAIMYARKTNVTNGDPVGLPFEPFTTVLKFKLASWEASSGGTLGGNPAGKSIQLKTITVSAPYPIAGDFDLIIPKEGNVSASIDGYNGSNDIIITPAEQLSWTYGESIEFSVFTIPISGRSLKDEWWRVTIETTDGTKRFTLKPASNVNTNFIAGQIHKLGIPGLPVQTPWEPKNESWIESIPRNVYLSELSLPGAWYSTDVNYQGDDIGLLKDSNNDGIDDGLAALYNAGIRAFHIDSRLSIKAGQSAKSSYRDSDMANLVLACAGTEKEETFFGIATGEMASIGMTVEQALLSLGKLASRETSKGEFIEVILTVSDKPKTNSSRVYGTVDPTMVVKAISNLIAKPEIRSYLYTDQINPNTIVNDVLGKIVLKVNVNAADAKIQNINASGPMLISEGSMAEQQYGSNKDILLGTFNKENIVPMHWSNMYKNEGQDGYMRFYYHQCQNTEESVTVDERKTAIWDILKNAKKNYNADTHNALYQLGLGGWTDDDEEGKLDIAATLSPFVNEIIEHMLAENDKDKVYTFKAGNTTETQTMQPTPVGAVLMNFALKDSKVVGTGLNAKTYKMNSSTLIENIIKLNAKCPMSRDENKPSWPGQEVPGDIEDLYIEISDWDNVALD